MSLLVGKIKDTYYINYIALDRPQIRESAINEPSLFFDRYKPPIIIDEIQKAPQLFEYVKDYADTDKKKGQFYLTGSQSLQLMKNINDTLRGDESLAGRAGVIKMLGLSMRELDGITYQQPFFPSQKHIAEMSKSACAFSYEAAVNLNKRLIKTPKIYFLDTGLACWLLGWNTPQALVSCAMWGHIFESFVVAEILKSYYNDGIVEAPLYYYRDKDKNEIDIIIQSGNTLHPVEIKATGDPQKSMISSFKYLDAIPGMTRGSGAIICMSREVLPITKTDSIIPVSCI